VKNLKNLLKALVIVFCLAAVILVLLRTKLILRLYDNLVLDSKNHYLSCEELPSLAEVEKVVKDHQDVIQKIKQINPGYTGIEIHEVCAVKADIVIWYTSHQDRVEIERIIRSKTFFGIPYRLHNR